MMGQRTNRDAPASQADAEPGGEPSAAPGSTASAEHAGAPDATTPDAGGEGAAEPADGEVQASSGEAPEEPEEQEEQGQPEEPSAQAEQEALWRGKTARAWHERTWLRALGVLVVLTGIAAIVPYPLRITAECTIIPRERVKVRAELPGVISEILVDEGQVVKKGDAIAKLDDRALEAERRKLVSKTLELQLELQPHHTAQTASDPASPDAALARANAELASVEERLAMTTVRAPIDGEILTPHLREHLHEAVEAGGLVAEIANTRRMRAEILVPEREVDAIAIGMPAVVKVEAYPTHPFEGKVDFIAPTVDSETRRIRAVVELDNEAGLLKANMTGFGEIEADKRSLLDLATRRVLRWIRVRFLL